MPSVWRAADSRSFIADEQDYWHSDRMTGQPASWASDAGVRARMRANRSRDTRPELAIRRLVHAAGLRYRVDERPLRELNRRADMVFRRSQVAVFVDGCFWHGCPDHHTIARANAAYWADKVERNRARDRETDERLEDAGWTVLRFWEHTPPSDAAARIVHVVANQPREP